MAEKIIKIKQTAEEKNKEKEEIKNSSLVDFLISSVRKDFGKESIMSMKDTEDKIKPLVKSGYAALDQALGIGGYPGGRILEIYGPEASGKTTLALHLAAEFQKIDGQVAFIDAENALDVTYARGLGVDINKLILTQPDSGEQCFDVMETMVKAIDIYNNTNKQKSKLLIIIDSVAAMSPKSELEGSLEDGTGAGMGAHARMMSSGLRRLVSVVRDPNILILFINQTRNKIGGYGNPEATTGGVALKFYASVRIQIRGTTKYEEGDGNQVGREFVMTVVKNKVSPPFKKCTGLIRFGVGIDPIYPIYVTLEEKGLIVKGSKGWQKIEGQEQIEQFIGGYKGFRTIYSKYKDIVDQLVA